ncbi:phosphatase PAP2 family protein [Embleya hyalina]|uniref:Phosphatase PAP2 family protein n=1 Tax=Embleya hyalina TaxID=516124 RepID=A0A401YF29_9ACTN|nr:phosphatase PAP2 family protein [Embleya hyalina]GCD93203.1 phosphatase PAP2 family protein [Embleya hyalina]
MSALALSGASVDGPLYRHVTDLARESPVFLDRVVTDWSTYGLALFAMLMPIVWWTARGRDAAVMARALAAPAIVALAYLLDTGLKSMFAERRPCRTMTGTFTLEACPGPHDWSFPSNHAVVAAAAATALWLVDRRIGALAAVAALAMAASRVWVGVHYPHDVAAGLLIGVLVAWPLSRAAGRAAPYVDRLRHSRWRACVATR